METKELQINAVSILNAIPGNYVILLPDTPRFTIVAVTDSYLETTYTKREEIIGQSIFEVFSDNPDNYEATEIKNIRASLHYVLGHRSEHTLPDQRYDLLKKESGTFERKVWRLYSKAILDKSDNVQYIIHSVEDVTGKVHLEASEKAAQKALEETERNLRNTILQAPVAMCIFRGPDHVVEIVNDHMLEIWGKTKEQVLNKPIFEGLAEATGQGLEELVSDVYTTGKRFSTNERPVTLLRNAKPEVIYMNFIYEPFKECDGKISGVIAVANVVTDQVIARQKIKESEEELQRRVYERTVDLEQQKAFISSILHASFNGIYALKTIRNAQGDIIDFQYLFANDVISAFLSLTSEEVVGKTVSELIPEVKTNRFFDLFCEALEDGRPMRKETFFESERFTGWFDYSIVAIDKDTLVVTVQDITNQKKSLIEIEQQRNLLDKIMKYSPCGITVNEVIRNEAGNVIDGKVILANDISEKFIAVPLDELLSKKSSEIDPDVLTSSLFQQALHTLTTGETFITQYHFAPTARWIELSVARMDENHLINLFTDVTPVKEAQLQLEKYVEDLKRSNTDLEEFAYAASHDLKEPVRKILFFCDRLKSRLKDNIEAEDQRLFERMEIAAKRMGILIDDLLVYSHVSRDAILKEDIDLNLKVANVLQDLDLQILERKAEVIVDPLPVVKGHRRQLQQLFQNLIGNALKYAKPDIPPKIYIHSTLVKGNETSLNLSGEEADKNYYLIEIQDNGIGFEQEDAQRIFKVFTRLHGNSEYKGTGVGLSIARKVAENHKGHIWAESKPGKGSVFKVLLPTS